MLRYIVSLLILASCSSAFAWIEKIGKDWRPIFENEAMIVLQTADLQTIVLTKEKLDLPFAEAIKFLSRKISDHNVLALFGMTSTEKLLDFSTAKDQVTKVAEVKTELYPAAHNTALERITLTPEYVLVAVVSAGKDSQKILKSIPPDPFASKRKPSSTEAGICPNCISSILEKPLLDFFGSIENKIEVSCRKGVFISKGEAIYLIGDCIRGFATSITNLIESIYEVVSTLVKTSADSEYRTQIKITVAKIAAQAVRNPIQFTQQIFNIALESLSTAHSNFRKCDAKFKIAEACKMIGYLLVPGTIGKIISKIKKVPQNGLVDSKKVYNHILETTPPSKKDLAAEASRIKAFDKAAGQLKKEMRLPKDKSKKIETLYKEVVATGTFKTQMKNDLLNRLFMETSNALNGQGIQNTVVEEKNEPTIVIDMANNKQLEQIQKTVGFDRLLVDVDGDRPDLASPGKYDLDTKTLTIGPDFVLSQKSYENGFLYREIRFAENRKNLAAGKKGPFYTEALTSDSYLNFDEATTHKKNLDKALHLIDTSIDQVSRNGVKDIQIVTKGSKPEAVQSYALIPIYKDQKKTGVLKVHLFDLNKSNLQAAPQLLKSHLEEMKAKARYYKSVSENDRKRRGVPS